MDKVKTIEVLEALASGCSPTTGEVINDNILNERIVIRALQAAIDFLKNETANSQFEVDIEANDINNAIAAFKAENLNTSANKLTEFLLGTRKFKNNSLVSNPLYGKYFNKYSQGQLLDFFGKYFTENDLGNSPKKDLYKEIDFFQKEIFNRLSVNAVNQLKEKVNELGILKTENLSEYIQNTRINHPRAYESWSEKESTLLRKALEYTNDLDLLSICFQRGKGSIEAVGKKMIYDSQRSKK